MYFSQIICSLIIILFQYCLGKALVLTVESETLLPYDEPYYEYVPDRMQWHAAREVCSQRSGAMAVVSNVLENRELSSFLQSLNITQPVWIAMKVVKQMSDSLILEFLGRTDRKSARLLQSFPTMDAVTVCARVRFDPSCHGVSTVFSYAIQTFINEFQLRAQVIQGEPIQLALLVHGVHSRYVSAFPNDASWHSVCVSWAAQGGRWAITVNGSEIGQGSNLYPSERIGRNGQFIIGQEQDAYGGSFKSQEAFCGSITQLYIWKRVLNSSEIQTMEKECSPIPSGLFFKWSASALEVEPSLQRHWGKSLCQDEFDVYGFPKTPFFKQVKKDLVGQPTTDGNNLTAPAKRDLAGLSALSGVLVKVLKSNPAIVTSSDILHLTQMMEKAAAAHLSLGSSPSEAIVSLVTNYLKLASEILDPDMAVHWLDLSEDEVRPRPFSVIESIDKLICALADVLWKDGKSYSISTNSIDVHLEPRQLSQASCSFLYKPSAYDTQSNHHDEILIPDLELHRLYSLGHKEVMFIHTYYSHVLEMQNRMRFDSSSEGQSDREGLIDGQLGTAIISATVRDVSRAENVPVSVQYSLSSLNTVEYTQRVTPVCVFWNFSLMEGHVSGWSQEGCRVMYSGPDVTTCSCSHTTNFAVLMNYMDNTWSPEEESVLTKLTFIGSGASLCALVVTLMLFTVLDIPKSDRTSIHKNLFISLTCAQIVLLCSGSAIHNKVACTLVAALLHLFFMAAFSWMLVEGLLLWSKVVTVNLSEDRHMKYYYLIGWGLPVLIVTITLASASDKYSADGHCWLSVQNGVIWGFAGPVIFIIMVNIMVLIRVVVITISTAKRRSLMMAVSSSPVEQAYEQIRAAVKAVLVLLPILGLTWLCGVLVPFSIAMAYVFILLNSLQGLFIFLIYGVYNTEVRSTVNRFKERRKATNFSNCVSSRPSSSVTTSRPGSCPMPESQGGEAPCTCQPGMLSSPHCSACVGYTSSSYNGRRHLSLPSVPGSLGETGLCPSFALSVSKVGPGRYHESSATSPQQSPVKRVTASARIVGQDSVHLTLVSYYPYGQLGAAMRSLNQGQAD
ncbi:adhesion G-protein coupled receptor D2 [Chanos chanos]|uniref:Adhesion G-protein coupled receptor D2 n=1 Tax=Chanos chanos TaxID=29144 RepID=A0A6J2W7D9_CHACN|nr:adhesion G-protein coupled receptor D2-like [Chanos chanos]